MIEIQISGNEYEQVAKNQRTMILKIAEKIKSGELLKKIETDFIVAVLHGAAEALPKKQPRKQGHPSEICTGSVLWLYSVYIRSGEKKNKTYLLIAHQMGVTKQAVTRIIKENPLQLKKLSCFLENAKLNR